MPYCSECGIHYPEEETTCRSCGHLLNPENSSTENATPVAEPAGEVSLTKAVTGGAETFNSRFQEESQLGKGLIKPFAVETEVDGTHFKYDKPPRSFSRAEVRKDITAEYRVTASDPDPKLQEELPEVVSPEWNDHWNEEYTEETVAEPDLKSIGLDEADIETPCEPAEPETAEAPASQLPLDETDLADQSVSGRPESEGSEAGEAVEEPFVLDVDMDFQPEEPELEPAEEIETLWEGRRTVLGIPRSTYYRITNRSVLLNDYQTRRVAELELQLISGAELKRSWLDKLFGVGDLMFKVKEMPAPGFCLTGIPNPEKVLHLLEDLIRSKV